VEAPLIVKRVLFPSHGGTTELEFDGLNVTVPEDERFNLCRELVLQRVYEVAGSPSGTVLDCGANVGMFTMTAFPKADRVVSVEPDPGNFQLLQKNVVTNGATNVELIQAAIWTEDGEIGFDTGTHSTGGGIDADSPSRVTAKSLDGLCDAHGPIDFLKLDIEGAEEEVIPQARLDGVSRIVAELHLNEPGDEQPMVDALREKGFDVEIVSASSLYEPRWIRTVLKNWKTLKGQTKIKLGVLAYLSRRSTSLAGRVGTCRFS
jgi:FkbM family methyltransferase